MKKLRNYINLLLIIFIFISYSFWVIYKNNVINNLHYKNKIIENSWVEYIRYKNKKNIKFLNVINSLQVDINLKDSLNIFLKNKFSNEKIIYKSENLKNYIINENKINNYSLILTNNINLINNKESELISLINQCNFSIEKFNNNVKDYNYYRSVFPNFFIAKKQNLFNLEFIELNYDIDYKIQDKESNIDKWIETGNDKYLKE